MLASLRLPGWLEGVLRPPGVVLLFSALVAIAILVLMQVVLGNGQLRAERELARQSELTVETLNRSVEGSFTRVVEVLNDTGATLLVEGVQPGQERQLRQLMAERIQLVGGLNELALYDRYGLLLARTGGPVMGLPELPGCVAQALAPVSDGLYLARPQPGQLLGDSATVQQTQYYIPFCIGMRDRSGELKGALVAAVDTAYFAREFSPVQSLSDARIELFSPAGVPLLSAVPRQPLNSGAFEELSLLAGSMLARESGSFQKAGVFFSYRKASGLPLVTVARQPVAGALHEWQRDADMLRTLFISLAVLSLFAGGVISRGLGRQARMASEIKLLSTAMSTTANSIFITDHQGQIEWVNQAFEQLTGWAEHEVLGQTPSLFNSGHHDPLFFRELWQTLLSGDAWRGQVTNHNRSGEELLVEQTITPILNRRGQLTHFVAIHEDLTLRARAEQKARYLSRHDQLTGLPNRRFLGEALLEVLAGTGDVALVFIDLDRFKAINDTQGHTIGDQLLQQVSQRLCQLAGEAGLVARLGSDEFALLLSGEALVDLEGQVRKLLTQMSQPFLLESLSCSLTISIGVALAADAQREAATLLRQADLAMFRAKHEGCNTFCFFEPEMDYLIQRHVQLDQGLREALTRDDQLSLRYQPILTAEGLQPVAIEVLMRWRNNEGEWVSPAEFIPVAEDSGLILEMGRWQIDYLFERLQQWRGTPLETLKVSLNLSAVQLSREMIAEHLLARMSAFEIVPQRIVVEITETALIASKERVLHNLSLLREAGVQLSIDDFGTGYSSLSYLSDLAASTLKIDRSFIIGIGQNRNDEEIIETMLGLAANLGLNVVAEGVDDPVQLAFLQKASCQMVQGFLFAKPLTEGELVEFMAAQP